MTETFTTPWTTGHGIWRVPALDGTEGTAFVVEGDLLAGAGGWPDQLVAADGDQLYLDPDPVRLDDGTTALYVGQNDRGGMAQPLLRFHGPPPGGTARRPAMSRTLPAAATAALVAALAIGACDRPPTTILDMDIDWGDCTFQQVEVVDYSICVVTQAGEAACWNAFDLTPGLASGPVQALAEVDSGRPCAIRPDGELVCWTHPIYELVVESEYPASIDNSAGVGVPSGDWAQAVVSFATACAVAADSGELTCWGAPRYSFLGVFDPPDGAFVDVDVDTQYGCGVRPDHTLACWGWTREDWYEANQPETWYPYGIVEYAPTDARYTQVEVDTSVACALDLDGVIHCWSDYWDYSTPYWGDEHGNEGSLVGPYQQFDFAKNSEGFDACGVTLEGDVECTLSARGDPITALPGPFERVSMSRWLACALGTDGRVTCWDTDYAPEDSTWQLEMPCAR